MPVVRVSVNLQGDTTLTEDLQRLIALVNAELAVEMEQAGC